MSNELAIPEYLKEYMHSGPSESDNLISASSVPRISLKGRKFKFVNGDDEIKIKEDFIHIVILGTEPDKPGLMAKTFYKEGYKPDSSDPPDCSSSCGIRPDSWVTDPQSQTCAGCPQNAWGSATSQMTGKKVKACKDSKRLKIMRPEDIGQENAPIYTVNVTVSSLKSLSEYGKKFGQLQVPLAAAITKVTMVEDSDFPQMSFELAGLLKEEPGKQAIERSKLKEWVLPSGQQLPAPGGAGRKSLPDSIPEQAPHPAAAPDSEPVTAKQSDVDDILNKWGD